MADTLENVETNEAPENKKKGGSAKLVVIIVAIIAVLGLAVFGVFMIAKPKGPTLTYLGHASVKLKTSKGTVIYIDPYCEEVKDAYKEPADIILVTHEHDDHSRVKLVTQKDNCVVINRKDALLNKTEYQTFEIGDVKIEAVPSGCNGNHYITTNVGYVVTIDGISVYHAGDCSMADEIVSVLKNMDIDYAMYPTDGIYNMGPEEATEMANAIGAKHNLPIHGEMVRDQFHAENTLFLEYGETIKLTK